MEDACFQKVSNEFNVLISELIYMNAKILSQQANYLSKCQEEKHQPGLFFITILKTIRLKKNELLFISEKEETMKWNFNEYFGKISHIFNDELPSSNKYFDLSSAIEKLSLLNPLKEKVNTIISEWKTQLGLIIDFLNKENDEIERKIQKEKDKTLLIQEELQIDSSKSYEIVKIKECLKEFKFNLELSEENNDEWISFIKILKIYFNFLPLELKMKELFIEYENCGRTIYILKIEKNAKLKSLEYFDDYPAKFQCDWYKPKSSDDAQILIEKCFEASKTRKIEGMFGAKDQSQSSAWIVTKFVKIDPGKKFFGGYPVEFDGDGQIENLNGKCDGDSYTAIRKSRVIFGKLNEQCIWSSEINYFFLVLQR